MSERPQPRQTETLSEEPNIDEFNELVASGVAPEEAHRTIIEAELNRRQRDERFSELVAQGYSTEEAAAEIYGYADIGQPSAANVQPPSSSPEADTRAGESEIRKPRIDEETKGEIRRIVGNITGIGFSGKVTKGTAIKASPLHKKLPEEFASLDVCNPVGLGTFIYPKNSPLQEWSHDTRGGMTIMRQVLGHLKSRYARAGLMDKTDNHLFTADYGKDGKANISLSVYDTSGEADLNGRPEGWQTAMFHLPNADARELEQLIRKNPFVFPRFFNQAAPGLARKEGTPPPGIVGNRSATVTIIDHDKFRPVIEETRQQLIGNASISSGLLRKVWPDAAEKVRYPE